MLKLGERLSETVSADFERAMNKFYDAKNRYRFVS